MWAGRRLCRRAPAPLPTSLAAECGGARTSLTAKSRERVGPAAAGGRPGALAEPAGVAQCSGAAGRPAALCVTGRRTLGGAVGPAGGPCPRRPRMRPRLFSRTPRGKGGAHGRRVGPAQTEKQPRNWLRTGSVNTRKSGFATTYKNQSNE